MDISKRQLLTMQQAIGYAIMYAKTEQETAQFALLKLDIDEMLMIQEKHEQREKEHEKLGCPFKYCDSNPRCVGKCHHT